MTGLTADVIITMCNSAHLFHVQNFKLEGLFLSKAKKIISMLLVVAMVLTVAPASMIASARPVLSSTVPTLSRQHPRVSLLTPADILPLLMQAKRRPIRRSSLRSRAPRSTKPRRSPRIRRAPFSSVQWTCLSRMVIPTPTL